mgnify:CR=1 FL=1
MANGHLNQCVGRVQPFIEVMPKPVIAQTAPTSSNTDFPKGQEWLDESVSPSVFYVHEGNGVWSANNLTLSTDGTFAAALDTTASSSLAIKTYADNLAIAGAPDASTTVKGIAELNTTAEAVAGTDTSRIMTSANVASVFAAPPALGSGMPGAGSFTTLSATGAIDFDAGGSFESGGATIDIGADASADAINLGTGAAARVITVGNVTGVTQVVLNSGTAGIALSSTGAGDITINSDDTLLLDSDGVLDLNSSGAAINIGNDADAFAINVGTGAAARTITMGNSTGATSLVLDCGTGALNVGTNAIAHTVTIGNATGATALVINCGTGNFALDGVAGSTYDIGASTTSGTITIGGTAQTGIITLGDSSGVNIVQIGSGEGATTVNIAGGATAAKAVNIATGAVSNTVSIGSASAGAIAIDTASGVSLDAATASNFTVSGALADLTLQSSAGRVVVKGEEAAVSAVELVSAAGGISASSALQLSLISSEAAVADSVRIQASAADGGIDVDAGTGGIAIDSTGALSLQGAAASDYSVSGAGIDLTLASASGSVIINGGEDAADVIYLHADAGVSEKIRIHADQGTSAESVELESDVGGITLTSGLASDDAINLSATAGGVDVDGALKVNIASSQAATGALTLAVSNASANITHTGACAYTPDSITSDNAGVAASINTVTTLITTDGDSNEDNVTLADGLLAGQIKHFVVIAAGNAADSIKITPANMAGGTKITFAADPTGLGCSMVFDGTNWAVFGNNAGTIA